MDGDQPLVRRRRTAIADPSQIACWQRIDASTTTSGKLVAEDIVALDALGVRHVINLALDSSPDALAGEARHLTERGIGYTHIPVPFESPQEAHYAAFRQAFAECAKPVHVHCIMNWRVSAFLYRYHREELGMSEAHARALMERQWSPESDPRYADTWGAFVAQVGKPGPSR